MRIVRTSLLVLLGAAWLAACTTPTPAAPTDAPTLPPADTAVPEPSPTGEPAPTEAPDLSFEPATFQDDVAGFAFEYPAAWMVEKNVTGGSRGSVSQLTSWQHPPGGITEVPADGTVLDVTVQLWDPKGDLAAFIAQRKGAWEASGISIVSTQALTLEGGQAAESYVVQGSDGAQSFFFFTTLGDDYLVLSGSGDLALLAEIAGTVRLLPASY
ncbi:MAG TPA: hypothetical protein VFI11_13565 [Anaerolineales bacterium]|nr:hypothetical protein [Anaerolineales bacterium]